MYHQSGRRRSTHGGSPSDTGHSLSGSGSGSHTTDGTGGGITLAPLADNTLFVAGVTDLYYSEDIPIPYRDVYGRDSHHHGGGDVTGGRGGGQGRHQHDLSGMPAYAGDQGYITMSFGDFGLGDSQSQTYGGDFGFGDSQSQSYGGSSQYYGQSDSSYGGSSRSYSGQSQPQQQPYPYDYCQPYGYGYPLYPPHRDRDDDDDQGRRFSSVF